MPNGVCWVAASPDARAMSDDHGDSTIESTLGELGRVLDRLTEPEELAAEELAQLARVWDVAAERLDRLAEAAGGRGDPRLRDLNRARLKQLIQRLPEIQERLSRHKSDIARQLFSENRRFQSLRSGYGAASRGSRHFSRQA